jgi:single-stranded-DNA-specific exonuclease
MPAAADDRLMPEWVYPRKDLDWQKKIEDEFKIHPVTAKILVARGFTTLESINDFLYSQLPSLHDPSLLKGMDLAVARVIEAVSNNERIIVYGDNDVDGISGTTLLTEFLRELGGEAYFYLTNRNITRDDLIIESIPFAKEKRCRVMITVDCGVTAAEEIAQVTREGIDVIVTDHHEPSKALPKCHAMINPKQPGCTYPNRDITGVGVAFKLAHGVSTRYP